MAGRCSRAGQDMGSFVCWKAWSLGSSTSFANKMASSDGNAVSSDGNAAKQLRGAQPLNQERGCRLRPHGGYQPNAAPAIGADALEPHLDMRRMRRGPHRRASTVPVRMWQ